MTIDELTPECISKAFVKDNKKRRKLEGFIRMFGIRLANEALTTQAKLNKEAMPDFEDVIYDNKLKIE